VTPDDLVLTPQGVRFAGRLWPCNIGRGGVSCDKREGDGATPRGVHAIAGVYYRPDRLAAPVPWAVPIGPGDLWSDDPNDAAYNMPVRAPYPHSHERLRRGDPLYDLVVVTGWNFPDPAPGRGSAIFLHQWRRPGYPTEGCVAFSRSDLRRIVQRLTPRSRLIVP
jgi:L,D-peptidoglycan transpeptidase YkuD (ErfK/YbiS/YcfS/YnhG family)